MKILSKATEMRLHVYVYDIYVKFEYIWHLFFTAYQNGVSLFPSLLPRILNVNSVRCVIRV